MPVQCYRVSKYAATRNVDGTVEFRIRLETTRPASTDIEELVRQIAPEVRPRTRDGVLGLIDPVVRLVVSAPSEAPVRGLLDSHAAPAVTAITGCGVTVCLDFYRHPGEDGFNDATYTAVGKLVSESKYGRRLEQNVDELAARVVRFVTEHPAMRTAELVAAMPSSQRVGLAATDSLVGRLALEVRRRLAAGAAELTRTRVTDSAQKDVESDDDADGNQADSMAAQGTTGKRVLVLDDLMRHASTVREADRALRRDGAVEVYALCLAKEYRGTKAIDFEALQR